MLAFRQARIEAERRRQKALEKETEAWEEEKVEQGATKSVGDRCTDGNTAATSVGGELDGAPSTEDVERVAEKERNAAGGVSCF